MNVFILETSYPKDFYNEQLDGLVTRNLLNTMGIKNTLKLIIGKEYFEKAIEYAATNKCDILHLSCHGSDSGIALCDNTPLDWNTFVQFFDTFQYNPIALVMSTCCGATSGLAEIFAKAKHGPAIIFGSTDALSYSEYCVAWAILYHQLDTDEVTKEAARVALRKITAVVSDKFVYRRWEEDRSRYLFYPSKGFSYEVTETKK